MTRAFLRSILFGAVAALVVLVFWAWLDRLEEAPAEARPKLDVPYVATLDDMVAKMLELAQVRASDHVIDLGCGDGRILVAAARTRGPSGYGVDLDPRRIEEAKANARRLGVADRLRFETKDLFATPIADATVVALYLLPEINLRLRPRLLSELRPGTRVVSHDFDMGDWPPDARADVNGAPLYLWIVPAQVAGRWTLTGPNGTSETIRLAQRYQHVTEQTSSRATLRDLHLTGDRLSFATSLGGQEQRLEGRASSGAITLPRGWRMVRAD